MCVCVCVGVCLCRFNIDCFRWKSLCMCINNQQIWKNAMYDIFNHKHNPITCMSIYKFIISDSDVLIHTHTYIYDTFPQLHIRCRIINHLHRIYSIPPLQFIIFWIGNEDSKRDSKHERERETGAIFDIAIELLTMKMCTYTIHAYHTKCFNL